MLAVGLSQGGPFQRGAKSRGPFQRGGANSMINGNALGHYIKVPKI